MGADRMVVGGDYNLVGFFNDTATTEIYTLSLHDALPILSAATSPIARGVLRQHREIRPLAGHRSEEHTSELQSLSHLVCRLLLETKNSLRAATCRPHKIPTHHGPTLTRSGTRPTAPRARHRKPEHRAAARVHLSQLFF